MARGDLMATSEERVTRRLRWITVVLPAYNEENAIGTLLSRLDAAFEEEGLRGDVLVVNDGSTDGTGGIAEGLARKHTTVRVVHNDRNMGVGYSYARGAALALKHAAVFVPGDNGWPQSSLRTLFMRMSSADIVMTYPSNPEVRRSSRRIVSRLYTAALNLLFGYRLRYYNGLAIYPTAFLKTHPVTTNGFAFMAELVLRALASGLSYAEVGVPIEERVRGRSKAVRFRNIVSVIVTVSRLYWVLRVRPN
jgi:glycosyltransferase involved in cell wall biosynthesis